MPARVPVAILGAVLVTSLIGCAGQDGSPAPPASVATSASPGETSAAPPSLAPGGPLAWPAGFGIDMPPGRYEAAPPFRLALTIDIPDSGWVSGHVGPADPDVLRFDGRPLDQLPHLSVGFALADHVVGLADVPIAGLSAGAVIDVLARRHDLVTSNRGTVELFGGTGQRIDIHALLNDTPMFGDAGVDYHLGRDMDLRLCVITVRSRLLLVLVSAAGPELEAAWTIAQPLLRSVDLAG